MSPQPPNPAIVREITTRLANGWTAVVAGASVVCTGPGDATLTITCDSEADAVGLLGAAQA